MSSNVKSKFGRKFHLITISVDVAWFCVLKNYWYLNLLSLNYIKFLSFLLQLSRTKAKNSLNEKQSECFLWIINYCFLCAYPQTNIKFKYGNKQWISSRRGGEGRSTQSRLAVLYVRDVYTFVCDDLILSKALIEKVLAMNRNHEFCAKALTNGKFLFRRAFLLEQN